MTRLLLIFTILVWSFSSALYGQVPKVKPSEKYSVKGKLSSGVDVSGAVALSHNRILLVGDEGASGDIVEVDHKKGKIEVIKSIQLGFVGGNELDAEGAAKSGNRFYVVGSHGLGRKTGDYQKSRYQMISFTLDEKGSPKSISTTSLSSLLSSSPQVGAFFRKSLDQNGMNIEGLAIQSGRLFVGLRAPSINGNAFLVSAPIGGGGGLVHPVPLGANRGVRGLDVVSRGLLILSGPADSATKGAAQVFFFDNASGKCRPLATLSGTSGKPEAILVIGESASAYSCLIFSDSVKDGKPLRYEIPKG